MQIVLAMVPLPVADFETDFITLKHLWLNVTKKSSDMFHVEHFLSKVRILMVFLLLAVGLSACKKENPNPENLDPIYKDLTKQLKEVEKALKSQEKDLERFEKELAAAPPRSVGKTTLIKDVRKTSIKIADLKQRKAFLDIRTERRRVEGRRAYKIAFRNGEEWPDPKEFENYKMSKELMNAPRNWNKRVPKLHKANPNFDKVSSADKSDKK